MPLQKMPTYENLLGGIKAESQKKGAAILFTLASSGTRVIGEDQVAFLLRIYLKRKIQTFPNWNELQVYEKFAAMMFGNHHLFRIGK